MTRRPTSTPARSVRIPAQQPARTGELLTDRAHLAPTDDPYRPQATRQYDRLRDQADGACVTIVHAEAWADAWWQRLTPEERTAHQCDTAWQIAAEEASLLGQTFKAWPEYPLPSSFVVSRDLLGFLSWDVVRSYNAAGLFGVEITLSRKELAALRQERIAVLGIRR